MVLYYNPATVVDRLFEDVLAASVWPHACAPSSEGRHATSRHDNVYRPRLDIYESKDANSVTATFELPGLTSNDVTIDVRQNRLTVSGETTAPDSEDYVVRERRTGKFSRTLQLPLGTQPDDVKAKMENGVLSITFPKTSPEQPAQRIVIQ